MDSTPALYLPVDWHLDDWMEGLTFSVKSAWIAVLTHVRALGNGRGSCKVVGLAQFAGMYGIGLEDAEALVLRALERGALVSEGGRWQVTDWHRFQSPDASKKRRLRTNVPDKEELSGTNTECPGQEAVVRDDRQLSRQDVQIAQVAGQTSLPPDGPPSPQHSPSPPISPQPSKTSSRDARMARPTLEQVREEMALIGLPDGTAEKFMAHYTMTGWRVGQGAGKPMRDWKAACQTWLHKWQEKQARDAKRHVGTPNGTVQDMGRAAMEAIYGKAG